MAKVIGHYRPVSSHERDWRGTLPGDAVLYFGKKYTVYSCTNDGWARLRDETGHDIPGFHRTVLFTPCAAST